MAIAPMMCAVYVNTRAALQWRALWFILDRWSRTALPRPIGRDSDTSSLLSSQRYRHVAGSPGASLQMRQQRQEVQVTEPLFTTGNRQLGH